MASTKRIADIVNVETEHGLGVKGGFVVFRVQTDGNVDALGQLRPAQARDIATHLFEAAARAEYEQDLHSELSGNDMPDEAIALIMHAVRNGEMRRHTNMQDEVG